MLAYAGPAIPVLVSLSGRSVHDFVTGDEIGEVVHSLVGAVGRVASVPVATTIAAYVVFRRAGGEHAAEQRAGALLTTVFDSDYGGH